VTGRRTLLALVAIAEPHRPVLASSEGFRRRCADEIRARVYARTRPVIDGARPLCPAAIDALSRLPIEAVVEVRS